MFNPAQLPEIGFLPALLQLKQKLLYGYPTELLHQTEALFGMRSISSALGHARPRWAEASSKASDICYMYPSGVGGWTQLGLGRGRRREWACGSGCRLVYARPYAGRPSLRDARILARDVFGLSCGMDPSKHEPNKAFPAQPRASPWPTLAGPSPHFFSTCIIARPMGYFLISNNSTRQ